MSLPIAVALLIAQALLLLVGYLLYKKAKNDLSARAAETPVLSEISSLQRNVKEMLGAIEEASDETTARLEVRCAEARYLLTRMDERFGVLHELETVLAAPHYMEGQAIVTAIQAEDSPSTLTTQEEATMPLFQTVHVVESDANAF